MFSKKYFRFSRNKSSRLYLISAKTTFFSSGQNILTFKLSFDDIQNCSRNIFYHCANIRSNTHESTHKRTFFFSGGDSNGNKNKSLCTSHQFPSQWAHIENLQSFCGSKYVQIANLEWKSIKKMLRSLAAFSDPALFILVEKQFNKTNTERLFLIIHSVDRLGRKVFLLWLVFVSERPSSTLQ